MNHSSKKMMALYLTTAAAMMSQPALSAIYGSSNNTGSAKISFNNSLVNAAEYGDTDVLKTMLKTGEDPNQRGDFDTTALLRAAYQGNVDAVKALLLAGANPNLADIGGATPLHVASREGHKTVVDILLKSGANVNIADAEGYTPLMRASIKGEDNLIDQMINSGADVAQKNSFGETAVEQAAKSKSNKIVSKLMAEEDKTPLKSEMAKPVQMATDTKALNELMPASTTSTWSENVSDELFGSEYMLMSIADQKTPRSSFNLLDFGSYQTEAEAKKKLEDLKTKHADTLKGLNIVVVEKTSNGNTKYHINAGLLDTKEDAVNRCKTLTSKGEICRPVETKMMVSQLNKPAEAPKPAGVTEEVVPSNAATAEAAPSPIVEKAELPVVKKGEEPKEIAKADVKAETKKSDIPLLVKPAEPKVEAKAEIKEEVKPVETAKVETKAEGNVGKFHMGDAEEKTESEESKSFFGSLFDSEEETQITKPTDGTAAAKDLPIVASSLKAKDEEKIEIAKAEPAKTVATVEPAPQIKVEEKKAEEAIKAPAPNPLLKPTAAANPLLQPKGVQFTPEAPKETAKVETPKASVQDSAKVEVPKEISKTELPKPVAAKDLPIVASSLKNATPPLPEKRMALSESSLPKIEVAQKEEVILEAKPKKETKAEQKARLKAEAKAEADAKAKAKAEEKALAKAEAEEKAKAAAEAKALAKVEAETKAAEAKALAKADADAKAKADAEAKAFAKAEAEAKIKAEAQAKADAKAVNLAEAKPVIKAEEKASSALPPLPPKAPVAATASTATTTSLAAKSPEADLAIPRTATISEIEKQPEKLLAAPAPAPVSQPMATISSTPEKPIEYRNTTNPVEVKTATSASSPMPVYQEIAKAQSVPVPPQTLLPQPGTQPELSAAPAYVPNLKGNTVVVTRGSAQAQQTQVAQTPVPSYNQYAQAQAQAPAPITMAPQLAPAPENTGQYQTQYQYQAPQAELPVISPWQPQQQAAALQQPYVPQTPIAQPAPQVQQPVVQQYQAPVQQQVQQPAPQQVAANPFVAPTTTVVSRGGSSTVPAYNNAPAPQFQPQPIPQTVMPADTRNPLIAENRIVQPQPPIVPQYQEQAPAQLSNRFNYSTPMQSTQQQQVQQAQGTQELWVSVGYFTNQSSARGFWNRIAGNSGGQYANYRMKTLRPATGSKVTAEIGPIYSGQEAQGLCNTVSNEGLSCDIKGGLRQSASVNKYGNFISGQRHSDLASSANSYGTVGEEVASADYNTWSVQLGTFDSKQAALNSWENLLLQNSVLQGLAHNVSSSEASSRQRLRAGKFSSTEAAQSVCEELRRNYVSCIIVRAS